MNKPRTRTSRTLAVRAQYARSPNNFLVNDPDGYPSDFPPIWWLGLDSGGGAYPIGPHGPWRAGVQAIPAVIRATALITGPLTAAPFHVTDGITRVDTPRWLLDPMLVRPDERFGGAWPVAVQLARGEFWSEWIRSAIWWGLGGLLFVEDNAGLPLAGTLRIAHPKTLSTQRDAGGALCWQLDPADGYSEPITFDRDGRMRIGGVVWRLVVLRNPHGPTDPEGMTPGTFEMSPDAFRLAGQIDTYSSGTFRSGVPAGYLKVTAPGLTQPAADDLRTRWLASHGGDRRSIAVLNSTTEFHALNLSPVDAALDQVKRLNLADCAFAFGLDPMTLGAGLNNSATYTNLRDAWANHRDFGLAPWIAAVDDTLSALMPGTQAVHVNLDGFVNPSASERFTAYKVAIDAGILTVDEVRALEGLAPAELEAEPEPEPEPTPPEVTE